MRICILALIVAVSCGAATARAVPRYILTDLGDLPGGWDSSFAVDINNSGQVVGQSVIDNNGTTRAFLWTPLVRNGTSGSMVDLGTLPNSPPSFSSSVNRINDYGQVIGLSGVTPFLWTPHSPNGIVGSLVVPLGLPSGLPPGSLLRFEDIDSSGKILAYAIHPTGAGRTAHLWSPTTPNSAAGTSFAIVELPNNERIVKGFNDFGQIVGSGLRNDAPYAYLWTPLAPEGADGSLLELGDLPGGLNYSEAFAVNSYGQVVGYSGVEKGNRAFLWTPTSPNGQIGSMVDLGDLPNSIGLVNAHAINSVGQVLMNTNTTSGVRSMLWTPHTPNGTTCSFVEIVSLLDAETRARWGLRGVHAINSRGQIVGSANIDPDGPGGALSIERAVLLTPVPEPAALVHLVICSVLINALFRCRVLQSNLRSVANE